MSIILNNENLVIPGDVITVEDLIKWKNITPGGTAVAIDNKLIPQKAWPITTLAENMHITLITAAFGG